MYVYVYGTCVCMFVSVYVYMRAYMDSAVYFRLMLSLKQVRLCGATVSTTQSFTESPSSCNIPYLTGEKYNRRSLACTKSYELPASAYLLDISDTLCCSIPVFGDYRVFCSVCLQLSFRDGPRTLYETVGESRSFAYSLYDSSRLLYHEAQCHLDAPGNIYTM